MSTLITAVLTHHLGWVTTVIPSNNNTEKDKNCPGNPLWGQLIDLYGATGYPTKVSHTIITGCNKDDLIPKILNILTYFIRCNNITKKNVIKRYDKEEENKLAETICLENSCIPKENFKKYEDHIREMTEASNFLENRKIQRTTKSAVKNTLKKTQSCGNEIYKALNNNSFTIPSTGTILNQITPFDHVKSDLNLFEPEEEIKTAFCRKTALEAKISEEDTEDDSKVVFLLGDDEKLIGLNKERNKIETPIGADVYLLPTAFEEDFKRSAYKDSDFLWNNNENDIKPSTSCTLLQQQCDKSAEFSRSKSVPPTEDKPETASKSNSKYRYSGVKFNFQQYPQIFTNFMRNKNIELSSFSFADKDIENNGCGNNFDFANCDGDYDDVDAFQTPTNATELQFTSDLEDECCDKKLEGNAGILENTTKIEAVQFPMPK